MSEINEKIIQMREARGWSENTLATEAELSQATVNSLFRRDNEPTLKTLKAICGAFQITLAQFFTEDEETAVLTSQEKYLIENFRTLTPEQKKLLTELTIELATLNKQ